MTTPTPQPQPEPPGQPASPASGASRPGAGLPPGAQAGISDAAERRALAGVAQWWWLFIVTGVIWILLAVVILQFSFVSVVAVGYIVGFMLLATGVEEILIASATERLKWLWYIVGIILVLGGLWSVFNPGRTATGLALSIGVLFGLIGVLWIIEGVASRGVNSAWVLGVVAGVLMIALAVWAAGQTTAARMLTLLTVAGIWSIMHGVGDIIRAVQLKRLGSLVRRGGI
jgi:uncharacterized membrane protein HdeD (DUF308 family)